MVLRCPACGNDMLSLKVLNDEQRRLVAAYSITDALKCEVCNVFYEKDALKEAIFSQ